MVYIFINFTFYVKNVVHGQLFQIVRSKKSWKRRPQFRKPLSFPIFHKSRHLIQMIHGRFVSSYRQNYSTKEKIILKKVEWSQLDKGDDSAGIYLLKVNNRNIRIRFEICSELTWNTPMRKEMHMQLAN